jgi:hypothetical protein
LGLSRCVAPIQAWGKFNRILHRCTMCSIERINFNEVIYGAPERCGMEVNTPVVCVQGSILVFANGLAVNIVGAFLGNACEA